LQIFSFLALGHSIHKGSIFKDASIWHKKTPSTEGPKKEKIKRLNFKLLKMCL
jgi:hypothetical protein